MDSATSVDLMSPDVLSDPHPTFHALRETAPISWNDRWQGWLLTSHELVATALKDYRLSADRITPYFERMNAEEREKYRPTYEVLKRWMVFQDPPDHTRIRSIANESFTPRKVREWEPRIRHIAQDLIDAYFRGDGDDDFLDQIAFPLPALVIASILGVPKEDTKKFKAWSDDLMSLVHGAVGDATREDEAQASLLGLRDYLLTILRQRLQAPRDDVLSHLANAVREEHITIDEATSTAIMLLFGGHETTTNLIANGLLALVKSEDGVRGLAETPIGSAVEELLRFEGPIKAIGRIAHEPLTIGGTQVRPGDRVLCILAAANRDPLVFDAPDDLNLARSPNPHLSFAVGPHFCTGASLARLEMAVTLQELLPYLPKVRLTEETLTWKPVLVNRGLESLRLSVTA